LWTLALWPLMLTVTVGSARAERIELGDGSVLMGTVADTGGETVTIHLDIGPVIAVRRADIAHRGSDAPPSPSPVPTQPPVRATVAPLRFHGSNTMGERLIPALVDRFVAARGAAPSPWLAGALSGEKTLIVNGGDAGLPREIEVRAFGSNTAFAALQTGAADIGLSSRRIRESESVTMRGLTEQVVALDGIAVIVHPTNPVRALTLGQLAGILSGDIADWSAVGGAPGPIGLRLPDERSALPETIQTLVMGGRRLTATAERVESSQELAARVAAEPGSMGLVSLAYIDQARALDIRNCSGSVAPTAFAVKAGDYPLTRRLLFYARPRPRPAVIDDVLAFSASPAGQSAIASAGFVNLGIESDGGMTRRARRQLVIDDSSIDFALARGFLKATEGASRLSLTFSFDEGGVAPGGDSEDDIRRLTVFMKSPAGQGHQLIVLGFSGPTDTLQKGTVLSEGRAHEIAVRLGKSGLKVTTVAGFGPITAQCAEAPDTRERSRRVEVWMR
jgi:phosphate transport system substrate-binding protein